MRRTTRVVSIVSALALAACIPDSDSAPEPDGTSADLVDDVAPSMETVPAADVGLTSEVVLARTTLGADDAIVAHWSLANHGLVPVAVPHWQIPTTELEENVFDITRDGASVRYYGKLAKRVDPRPEDLVTIDPGETLAADVELTRFYHLGKAGQFAIAHADTIPVFVDGAPRMVAVRSTTVNAVRTAELPNADEPAATASFVTPGYRSCSSTRKTQIQTALGSAQTYASNSVSYLATGAAGPRYTSWFGAYTSSRYATVKSHFANINSTIASKTMTFDCTCTDSGTYAYVYPDSPYVVYFCGAFWAAPNTGTDSRAGTIIHETSHFNVVAGTNDWAYGKTACKNLASSNPTRAVDNADCHEYFAENTPAQN